MKITHVIKLVFLLFITCGKLQAQDVVKAVISADRMNILYRGLHNPISVSTPGYHSNEIKITCNNCDTLYGENGSYKVKPGKLHVTTFFIHSLKKKDKGKIIDSLKFKVHQIPNPTIRFIEKSHHYPDVRTKFEGGALVPFLDDFDFELYIHVNNYTISFFIDCELYEKKIDGAILPSEQVTIIKQLPNGTRINFKKLEVLMPDGTIRELETHYYLK